MLNQLVGFVKALLARQSKLFARSLLFFTDVVGSKVRNGLIMHTNVITTLSFLDG